ncbi:hypothetical protein [Actinomadura sp. WMMB 499]|uniref:hypothetical protein n=1 Tax=Actinomadura sp. WMMB 499 TaxID=1219491 RepID=UPI001245C40F|nr:hypothetical protein [Actinomadura sp. WMMB 499]QFG20509.1 hypothetical protein F7P10_04355 [Actinomadura sp. WMMB 499]
MNRLAAHGDALDADARAMAAHADRLRALAARLRAQDAAPDWLFAGLHDHITACVVASDELAEAAARIRALAAAPARGRRE